ncbi:MAG: Crp/Fnr family transcriptional regulator [Vulcanimicrobiota bacterium]
MTSFFAEGYLAELTPAEHAALAPYLVWEDMPKGSTLFRQGDAPNCLYILVRGCLKVTRAGDCGRSVITELIFPGEICGGMCALGCSSLSVGAVALEDSALWKIPVLSFQELSQQEPGLMLKALDCCRRKFTQQREMLVGMALERAEQRAARGLLMLVDEGDPQGQTATPRLRVNLSRREFSELIGSTVETAVRILSDFRKRGLVQETEDSMEILDLPGLRLLATEPILFSATRPPR